MTSRKLDAINQKLQSWRQGDVALHEKTFVHVANPNVPLTNESAQIKSSDSVVDVISETEGLVVLSQTCDIVRNCKDRPFIKVAALVSVDDGEKLELIKKKQLPRYAFIPGVASLGLVADLDRVMTVEKSLVADWERLPGCANDEETREFAKALSRKLSRFAFPDDFNNAIVSPLWEIQNFDNVIHIKAIKCEALEFQNLPTPSFHDFHQAIN